MFRVLIADDEPWILEGIKASIDWAGEGFDICATATNGVEALEKATALAPDLILADIKMPGLDGLQLLGLIHENTPQTLFAIISGYAEFAYAQEALRLGAIGYLLKPIEETELEALVRDARARLLAQRIRETERAVFQDMENGSGYVRRLFPDGCTLHVQIGGDYTTIAEAAHACQWYPGHFLLLADKPLLTEESALPPAVRGLGIYAWDTEREDFMAALSQAESLAYRFFLHPGQRLFTRDGPAAIDEPLKAFYTAVRNGDMPAMQAHLRAFRALLPSLGSGDVMALWHTAQLIRTDSDGPFLTNIGQLVKKYGSAARMLDAIELFLLDDGEETPQENAPSLKAYLDTHYTEDLSLIDLSYHFHISASTIRRRIRQETGQSFQQYLIHCRIQAALQLLAASDLYINDIAGKCGFEDPLYFRKAFKKATGYTPTEYRAQLPQE